MKKFFAVLLAAVMILGCVSALAEGEKIALVTDVGTIDDESFNQACWQAVEAFAIENDVEYTYYQPNADSLDARLMSIDQAVTEGASVIVMPGYLFGATLVTAQDKYPDVKFIAVDVSAGDLTVDYTNYVEPAANVVCVTFSEEQAGFLAGYAAVKDGYTKLGFLGGMAVPAVIRYGYGFVQGADKAAAELDKQIEINYTYGGQFFGDAAITAKMEGGVLKVKADYAVSSRFGLSLIYSINAAGSMQITMSMDAPESLPNLFRFGLQIPMPASFENISYYGRGPVENYIDRQGYAALGIYNQTVTDQYYPYVRPQETGTKTDLRWWTISEEGGLKVNLTSDAPFSASALHYTVESLDSGPEKQQMHGAEIPQADLTNLLVDKVQMGLGCVDSWYSTPRPEYMLPSGKYEFNLKIDIL